MRINKAIDFFIQKQKFLQLNCCNKWTVGILSVLPALTLTGIIASPFIWKGMVKALLKKQGKSTTSPLVSNVASKMLHISSIRESKKATSLYACKSSSIVQSSFSMGEKLTDDFKHKFLGFISGKTPAEIEELAGEPPFDCNNEELDLDNATGKVILGKLGFIFSSLNDQQLAALLRGLFAKKNNPSQELFDSCYFTLCDQGKKELFDEIVEVLAKEDRLKDFKNGFVLCSSSHHTITEDTKGGFIHI